MHIFFRYLLWPLSVKYGLIMELRSYLYRKGVFKVHHYNTPIISVGNITAGGTGKSPFTLFLAERFINSGKKIAIVSRGYGRKSKGFIMVSDGKSFSADPAIHGDEPTLMARRLPEAIIAVSEKRYLAIEYILQNYDVDIFLLDDGFQHHAVSRDLDIVLLREWSTPESSFVLPAGHLREFKSNINRADLILNTGGREIAVSDFNCTFESEQVVDADFTIQGKLSDYSGQDCVAFAAIAKPQLFQASLEKAELNLKKMISFKDHHYLTDTEFESIINVCIKNNCSYLFCTEKDLIKISLLSNVPDQLEKAKIKLLAARLQVVLNDEKSFLQNVTGMLD